MNATSDVIAVNLRRSSRLRRLQVWGGWRKLATHAVLAWAVVTLSASVARGQAPGNNTFTNAWLLNDLTATTNGTTASASKETGEPNHAGNNGGRSVWFNWIAPLTTHIEIDTVGSAHNTLLAVYTGSAVNALTAVALSDDAPGLTGGASRVTFLAAQGTTYRIAVDSFREGGPAPAGGAYALNLRPRAFVNLTAPVSGSLVYAGTPVQLAADADVVNSAVNRVEFYRNGVSVGSDSDAPYQLSVDVNPVGTNQFQAVAVDGAGRSWPSLPARVAVLDVGATILFPPNGAIFQTLDPIQIVAATSLPTGVVTRVEFFLDDVKLGEDTAAPFSLLVSPPPSGVHRIHLISWDNFDNSYVSTPSMVSFPSLLLPFGSTWKYLDDGSNQGTNWTRADYLDASWSSGPAQLGYGDGDEATVVSYGPDAAQKFITTYFRRTLPLARASQYTNLVIRLRRDDGAILHLNGREALRANFVGGDYDFRTPALLATDDGNQVLTTTVNGRFLRDGENQLAVEVHQESAASDDLTFDLEVLGVSYPTNLPPRVMLTGLSDGAFYRAPETIVLTAEATDLDGTVTGVRFEVNGQLLGEALAPPYSVVWDHPPVGRFTVQALAFDDVGTRAGSAPVHLTVFNAAGTPLAAITSPTNGSVHLGPTNLLIKVTADAPEPIRRVQLLANGELVGDAVAGPYVFNWAAPFGTNQLTVVVEDVTGARGTSAVAQVTITIPPTNTVAPSIIARVPAAGLNVTALPTIRVTFSERVSGVDAADLLVNGTPAVQVAEIGTSGATYQFTLPALAQGTISVTWRLEHGIADFGYPASLPFNEAGPGATWSYSLVDRTAPTLASIAPTPGTTVTELTQVAVTFSEPVNGVDASDLLVNGNPATGLAGSDASYLFSFPRPGSGTVVFSWVADDAIVDRATTPNAFNGTNASWTCVLDETTPPVLTQISPAPGSVVDALTSLSVTFSEAVQGVTAGDLLINGRPASAVSGTGAAYTFTFAPPNGTFIRLTWANLHGILDLAPSANAFDRSAPGATWTYSTIDTVPPSIAVDPPPSVTLRRLKRIQVTFDEPVVGVNSGDLRIDGVPAASVSGSGAGPYVFAVSAPATGLVQVAFSPTGVIADLASPANSFGGASWTYVLNPAIATEIGVSHVIQMSLDGLGAKYLEQYVDQAPDQFPNFVRLMAESSYTFNARCDFDISETIPNHTSMFTGRPVFQPNGQPSTTHHGYNNNFPGATDTIHVNGNPAVPYKSSMFDVAHDYGRSTAFFAGKTRLLIAQRSYDGTNGAADATGPDNGRNKIDFAAIADISGAAIASEVDGVLATLTNTSPKEYTFVHIAEPDITGHASNWGSANWSNAVRSIDVQLGRILDAIDMSPLLANQTALIVTADHGGGGVTPNAHTESYHITNYTVPFFLRAPGVPRGGDLYALFLNRGNPGTNRTDYTTQPQPIRNGDGSNLALGLLGLPPIPGSFMVPLFDTPANSLRIARFENRVTVFWSDPDDEYDLETTEVLGATAAWQPVTNVVRLTEGVKSVSTTETNSSPRGFYRLRQK